MSKRAPDCASITNGRRVPIGRGWIIGFFASGVFISILLCAVSGFQAAPQKWTRRGGPLAPFASRSPPCHARAEKSKRGPGPIFSSGLKNRFGGGCFVLWVWDEGGAVDSEGG